VPLDLRGLQAKKILVRARGEGNCQRSPAVSHGVVPGAARQRELVVIRRRRRQRQLGPKEPLTLPIVLRRPLVSKYESVPSSI
jgi:hypothetical protein